MRVSRSTRGQSHMAFLTVFHIIYIYFFIFSLPVKTILRLKDPHYPNQIPFRTSRLVGAPHLAMDSHSSRERYNSWI